MEPYEIWHAWSDEPAPNGKWYRYEDLSVGDAFVLSVWQDKDGLWRGQAGRTGNFMTPAHNSKKEVMEDLDNSITADYLMKMEGLKEGN